MTEEEKIRNELDNLKSKRKDIAKQLLQVEDEIWYQNQKLKDLVQKRKESEANQLLDGENLDLFNDF